MTWKTIQTYSLPHEAHIAQSKLESEGISTMLVDENTVQIYHFYSPALGGVKLQVQETDVLKAIDILNISLQQNEDVPDSYTSIQYISRIFPRLQKYSIEWQLTLVICAAFIVLGIIASIIVFL